MDRLDRTGVSVDSFQQILSARIDLYGGQTIKDQVDSLIRFAPVVVFGRSCCPFTVDSIHLLSEIFQVHTHVVRLDALPDARGIIEHLRTYSSRRQFFLPSIFVRGQFLGGCEELFRLNHNQTLELDILRGLINRTRTVDATTLSAAKLPLPPQARVTLPLLLFPPTVNNHVSRITSLLIFSLSVVGASFYYKDWEPYISLTLLLDFTLRLVGGEASSPFAMLATVMVSLKTPLCAPGVAKQLDAGFGVILSSLVILFSFLDFSGHDVVACILLAVLALVSGLEGFFKVSLGSRLVEPAIRHGILPPHIYRIFNFSRPEMEDTYRYLYSKPANIQKPVRITTDRTSPVALRYKKKSPDWKQHDWDALRHLHVHYLFCPLSLAALAMAFKISADTLEILGPEMRDMRFFVVPNTWFSLIACFGAFVLVFMLFLFITKIMLYPQKLRKERTHPLRGASLSSISIAFMIFGFLCYDKLVNPSSNKYSPGQVLGRVFFWLGSLSQLILSIAAVADWIGRPFTLESIQPHWLIYPIGLGIASFTAPVVEPLPSNSEASSESTRYISELYFSLGWLLWIVLFTVSFLKVVLQPIPDNRGRHGVWFWVAAPCVMGLSDFFVCFSIVDETTREKNCTGGFSAYYFQGILLFLTLVWTCAPHIRFLSVEPFNMWYWLDCFSIGILATCAASFYVATGWQSSAVLEFIFLLLATSANFVAFMHTLTCLLRKHSVCTPEPKLSPLSFLSLTHDAMRASLLSLDKYLQLIDIDDDTEESRVTMQLFVAHFNRFRTTFVEHARQEDAILYSCYRDWFPDHVHGKKYSDDHQRDTQFILGRTSVIIETMLDPNSPSRKDALLELRNDLPSFFEHLLRHFRGEEENMDPIFKKHIPIELQKQLAREVFKATRSEAWELIIPYVLVNLPRHEQRVHYLKSLCWSIPERSQQIGAIAYRNVDSMMWARLRFDFPEMIPRGTRGWRRIF